MVKRCKLPQTMLNWEKVYGNACGNIMKSWYCIASWPIHVCRVRKVAISLRNLNFSHIEHFITYYQHITRYHNLNALSHALPHTLPYIFSEICLVLSYLQRFTTSYRHFFSKNY